MCSDPVILRDRPRERRMRTNAYRSRMVRFYWNRIFLAGPLLSEIETRFQYYNPAKELKIVHRAFWKFALWPGINESRIQVPVASSSDDRAWPEPGRLVSLIGETYDRSH